MKNKSRNAIITLASSLMMLGAVAGCKTQITVWTHYKANAPTEEARGNYEFWINIRKGVTLSRPRIGKVVEGKSSDLEKYDQYKEIWIENELKVTKGNESFVMPLAKFPELYYAEDSDYSTAEYKLLKEVKLEEEWTAIGNEDKPFKGVFDGNDKTIFSLTINTTNYYQGLFGLADDATFKNIKLADVNINANALTGGILGFAYGTGDITMESCSVLSGSIKSTLFDMVGGLIGGIYDPIKNVTVKNCLNAAKVESTVVPGRVGGIIGLAGATQTLLIENCANAGEIKGQNAAGLLGGTRGNAKGATYTFRNCSNLGSAKVPYVGFVNSAARAEEYIKVVIENGSTEESLLPTLFSVWQSGGTEGGILNLTLNGEQYRFCLLPKYTYSDTEGAIVMSQPVYKVQTSMQSESVVTVTEAEWEEFLAITPRAAIYNEDGSYRGVSPTTNCYAPNSYYIKGAQFGALVNNWVKIVESN